MRRERGQISWAGEDLPFVGVGLLWLVLRARPLPAERDIVALCEWISATEAVGNARHYRDFGLPPGRWLLSTTYFNLCHAKWEWIGSRLCGLAGDDLGPEARGWVQTIGGLLAGD